MVHALNKGKNGEREIINLLKQNGINCVCRNLDQARDGGSDILGIKGLCVEVKRQEKLAIDRWWQQVLKACKKKQIPVLIYRQSRKTWQVVTIGCIFRDDEVIRVTIDIEDWIRWLIKNLKNLQK